MPRLTDDRLGGEPRRYLTQPKGILMRISDEVKRCVAFVGIREDAGIKYGGTIFFVSVTEESQVIGDVTFENRFCYIVTAKHVAQHLECSDCVIRMNDKDGRSVLFEAAGIKWFYHPTESEIVDCAIAPFAPPKSLNLSFAAISHSLFATPELIDELEIGVGDEIYIAGLFSRVTETAKNQPVVRTGNIAMMPDEKILFSKIGMIDAYLVETKSFGGLSGCPVFVRHTISTQVAEEDSPAPQLKKLKFKRLHGGGSSCLFGVMIGHWQMPKDFDPALGEALNYGVSVVVPMYKIIEVLNHPELTAMRKTETEQAKKKLFADSVLDSALDAKKPASDLQQQPLTKAEFETVLTKVTRKKTDHS